MTAIIASSVSATVTAIVALTTSKKAACASIASTTLPATDVKSASQTFSAIRAKIRTIRLFACVSVGRERGDEMVAMIEARVSDFAAKLVDVVTS